MTNNDNNSKWDVFKPQKTSWYLRYFPYAFYFVIVFIPLYLLGVSYRFSIGIPLTLIIIVVAIQIHTHIQSKSITKSDIKFETACKKHLSFLESDYCFVRGELKKKYATPEIEYRGHLLSIIFSYDYREGLFGHVFRIKEGRTLSKEYLSIDECYYNKEVNSFDLLTLMKINGVMDSELDNYFTLRSNRSDSDLYAVLISFAELMKKYTLEVINQKNEVFDKMLNYVFKMKKEHKDAPFNITYFP